MDDAELDQLFAPRQPASGAEAPVALLDGDDDGHDLLPVPDGWPDPPRAAFHGLAGDTIAVISPQSESDPVALLGQFLAAAGSQFGRGPHIIRERDRHSGNLFLVPAGISSRGRKGTSWGHVENLFEMIDPQFGKRVHSGLSSGEGLVEIVRDRDPGDDQEETDKRLLVVETELAGAFKSMERHGNRLSPLIRQAYDGRRLETMTKNPVYATGAHISIIGHITVQEIRRVLNENEAANGFGNRFIWLCVRRWRLLPHGGNVDQVELNKLAVRLAGACRHALRAGHVHLDADAKQLWSDVYGGLSTDGTSLAASLTARAEAQVTRIALIYALLDQADAVGEEHIVAALDFWEYSLRSVKFIFGASTGNGDADEILRALRRVHPDAITDTDISRTVFGGNIPAVRLRIAKETLLEQQLAHQVTLERTGTRGPIPTGWRYGKAEQ